MRFENLGGCEHDFRPIRDDSLPGFTSWTGNGRGHQAKCPATRIRANVKHFARRTTRRTRMMPDIIFMVIFPRSDDLKIAMRLIRTEKADFTRCMARDGEENKMLAARAFDFQAKPLIGFLVEQGIRFRGAERMAVEPVRALGGFILDGVEECAVVSRPGDTRDSLASLGQHSAADQILHMQQVLM